MSFATINPPSNEKANPKIKHIEDSPRRVRVLFNKKFIADTKSAKLVWEHPYYPNYFLPVADVQTEYLEKIQKNDDGDGQVCRLTVGNRSVDKVIWFEAGVLNGLVRFQFSEMGVFSKSTKSDGRCMVRRRYANLRSSEGSVQES